MKKITFLLISTILFCSIKAQNNFLPDTVFLNNLILAKKFKDSNNTCAALNYLLKNDNSKFMRPIDYYRIANWGFICNIDIKKVEYYFRKAIKKGRIYDNLKSIQSDTLLNSNLSFVKKYKQRIISNTIDNIVPLNKDLAKILDSLAQKDQVIRMLKSKDRNDSVWRIQKYYDSLNQMWLYKQVKKYGWLGYKEVGIDGENTSWFIAQHCDNNIQLQKYFFKKLIKSFYKGNITNNHLAYLFDRIRVNENKPQFFGTQFNSDSNYNLTPKKLENEKWVNAYRYYASMFTIEEYLEKSKKIFQKKNDKNK